MKNRRGFTLIELMVVISIIGMLSSIVLAATTRARFSANVGAMKAEFNQLRTVAEVFYQANNSTWGPLVNNTGAAPSATCSNSGLFADTNFRTVITKLQSRFPAATTIQCVAASDAGNVGNANTWSVYIQVPALTGGGTDKWCVDNTRYSAPVNGVNTTIANITYYTGCCHKEGISSYGQACTYQTSTDW